MAPPPGAEAGAAASGRRPLLLSCCLLLLVYVGGAQGFLLPSAPPRRTTTPISISTSTAAATHTRCWAYYINDTFAGGGSGGYGHGYGYNSPSGGRVTLVGAGPGDPELLTLAAVKALGTAELVIADRLIPGEILNLVKGELRIARKHPGCAEQAQKEIYEWVKEGVDAGRHVVRLKIGDPFLFGRGGEEIHEFRAYGVEPQVIPGVSSAFSAPLLSAIPVTHRGVANQVYICTGYGRDGDRPYLAPYYPNQTAVFLMAVGRLRELCANLEQVGYPTTTPVAIVERASTPRQRTLLGTVATIPDLAEEEKAAAPAVVVVGEVVHVLLERGPKVLHGAVGGWVRDAAAGDGVLEEGEALVAVDAAAVGGKEKEKEGVKARLGGMRGGGGEGEAASSSLRSLPRRLVRGVVGAVSAVFGGRKGQ